MMPKYLGAILGVCVLSVLILVLMRSESEIELRLKRDLNLSSVWTVSLVEKTSFPSTNNRETREEALFVKSAGRKHVLALAYRNPDSPNANESRWRIAETSIMSDDGRDEWICHERAFYYFPSRAEIEQFRTDAPWY